MTLSYGISERFAAADEIDVHAERIRRLGYSVVESGLSTDALASLRETTDRLLRKEEERWGGRERLARLGETDVVRAPLAVDDQFLGVATNPTVLALVRRLIAPYIVLMQQNAIVNAPSEKPHHQTAWHRDLPYQHFTTSRPIAINALLCIDPFEPEMGATWVLPGSHTADVFPSDDYVAFAEVQMQAPVGSYIVMDSMLYHRAGWNQSGRVRRAVNNVYTPPFIKQQISLPRTLGGRWSDDLPLKQLLGYETETPGSVEEYIASREARQKPQA